MDNYVVVSGGFDPLHDGHIEMFKDARTLGDKLIVLVNNDNWLINKKSYNLIPENTRHEVISNLEMVDKTYLTNHELDSSRYGNKKELEDLKESIEYRVIGNTKVKNKNKLSVFANGGDRDLSNTPEYEWCIENGVTVAVNVGGSDKKNSSSDMFRDAYDQLTGNNN